MITNFKIYESILNDNFWKWFGNSKTLDSSNKPIIFYHGTNRDFDEFRSDRLLFFTNNTTYATMYTGGSEVKGAHYISKDEKDLEERTKAGRSIIPVYLKIENPFDTRNNKEKNIFLKEYYRKYGNGAPLCSSGLPDWTDAEDLQEFFEDNGYNYDGIYVQDSHENITTVVFNPNQVKSAIGNNGNYSLYSNNINENKLYL